MARYDDLNTTAIGYATLVSTILLLIIILLVRSLCYYWVEGEADRKLADTHYVEADAAIGDQRARLSGYGKEMVTVTVGEGAEAKAEEVQRLHIPLEDAQRLLLGELASQHADGESDDAGDGHSDEHGDDEHEGHDNNENKPDDKDA